MKPVPEVEAAAGDAPQHPLQREFFSRMGLGQQFRHLFEYLPDIYFFVKDADHRLIAASTPFLRRLGLRQDEIVGRTDYDDFPPQIADGFVCDDCLVMQTGQPLINRVEIWYNEQHLLDWFITTKIPVRDAGGRIIGVMGIVQSYEGKRKLLVPFSEIREAVDFIRANHRERITIEQLAERTLLSPRQLNRKFHAVFGMSAQEFLMKTRIEGASHALVNSDASISKIALDHGFCDQSAFTQQFRNHTGMTPLQFRKRYSERKS